MRIISDFHDYYDGVQSHGFDDKVVYLRKTVTEAVPLDKVRYWYEPDRPVFQPDEALLPAFHTYRPYPAYTGSHSSLRLSNPWDGHQIRRAPVFGVLYFCGKAFPFWLAYPVAGQKTEPAFSFEDEFESIAFQTENKRQRTSYVPSGVDPTPYREWLSRHWGVAIDPKVHFAHRSPAILYIGRQRLIDPCLRAFNFHRVLDAYAAFQEIDMFLGGVMGTSDDPPSPQTDVQKVSAHGMDPKWSFRKPPQPK